MIMSAMRSFHIPPVIHRYTVRDTILYALGLGYGSDPADPAQLAFVYEPGLKAVPSLCGVLAHPGFWAQDPRFGIDWLKLLHGEQSYEIHRPIPTAGEVRGTFAIAAIEDKGAGKGAIVHQVKQLTDADGTKLATIRGALFLRGDGGCGSFGTPPAPPAPIPDGEPVASVAIPTLPQQALIYRLSGDPNPIHADPAAARQAGFDRPILHGLCTLGVATRAAIQAFAPDTPEALTSMSVRFSRPVFPGETIVTEFFRIGDAIRFRSRVRERDVVVLDRGYVAFAG